MQRYLPTSNRQDKGFTLVELLIVIVILGVLSTVTVFAVSGIANRGEDAAADADEQVLSRAAETYNAQNGTYTDEAGLVAAGLLKQESDTFDISLGAGNTSYTLVAEGQGSGVSTITLLGFEAEVYGSGPNDILFIGDQAGRAQWDAYVAGNGAFVDNARMLFIDDPAVADAQTILDLKAEVDFIASQNMSITGLGVTDVLQLSNDWNWGPPVPSVPSGGWFFWDPTDNAYSISAFVDWANI